MRLSLVFSSKRDVIEKNDVFLQDNTSIIYCQAIK